MALPLPAPTATPSQLTATARDMQSFLFALNHDRLQRAMVADTAATLPALSPLDTLITRFRILRNRILARRPSLAGSISCTSSVSHSDSYFSVSDQQKLPAPPPRAPPPCDSVVSETARPQTLLPPYKAQPSPHRTMFPLPPSYENTQTTCRLREIDSLLASMVRLDFEPADKQGLHDCLSALKASLATFAAPETSTGRSVDVVQAARAFLSRSGSGSRSRRHTPSPPSTTPVRDPITTKAREDLAHIVHRRMAMLRLEGRGGSVQALEHWYREVVKVLGWRDRDESEVEWIWRREGGFF